MKFASKLVHFDSSPGDDLRPMATPIYQTATFEQEHADSFGAYDYSRSGNPTRRVLEDHVASLENGTRGFAFSSGMAAIANVAHLLTAGDEILADWDVYGGTARLFGRVLTRFGIKVRYVDASVAGSLEAHINAATRMIYVESPTNPMLRIVDLRATAEIARRHRLLFCVDNSTMSPYLQNPLDLGADIVIHSATKFLCGHSDVTGGVVVVKDAGLADQIYFLQNAEGTALGPFDCFLLLRGIKTLKVRLDVQQRNAMRVADFLSGQSAVSNVYYPGASFHVGHEIHQAQARGGGAVLSFTLADATAAKMIAETSRLFRISVSFGSVSSTISVPVKMSHASVPAEILAERSIPNSLLRLSIGIEDVDDLLEDLATCLKQL